MVGSRWFFEKRNAEGDERQPGRARKSAPSGLALYKSMFLSNEPKIGARSKAVLPYAVFPSEQAYRRFQRRVDRLSFLIVATDISVRDINIERLFLRTEAARLFPERFRFYEMLYESRFQRLVEQFRATC